MSGYQSQMFDTIVDPKDIVYTPSRVCDHILKFLNPTGSILDPCKGDGAFFNLMPEGSDYCEIQEGKDFFEYNRKVDWIIGNPPYSIFETFLRKDLRLPIM